jgi:hypothetical protein
MKISVHLVLALTAMAMLSAGAFGAQYAWSVSSPLDSQICALSEEALVTANLTRDGIPVANELVTLAVEGDVSARRITQVHTDANGNITVPFIHHLDLGHNMPESDWETMVKEAKAHVEFQNAN